MASFTLPRQQAAARPETAIACAIGLLFAVDAALVGLYLWMALMGPMVDVLSVEAERSVPTWFASMQLLLVGQVCAVAAFLLPRSAWAARLALLGLALVFIILSADEIASFHERFGWRLTAWVADGGSRDELLFARTGYWMVALLPITVAVLAALGIAYVRTGRPSGATVTKALAGLVLLMSGAAGLEALQNFVPDGPSLALAIAVEEGLELTGGTLLLWAALDELVRLARRRAVNRP